MRISCFNINKFCGPYSNKGQYYNPRNLDFRTPIKELVDSLLKTKYDIFFLQEFIDNKYIKVNELFPEKQYSIFSNLLLTAKSNVVAITLRNSSWERINQIDGTEYTNKFLEMELKSHNLSIISFHNTNEAIKDKVDDCFKYKNRDIILGDFNNSDWLKKSEADSSLNYKDLVTDDMITFKPAQTSVDRIFIKKREDFKNKIEFDGIVETFLSDHNLLTFSLNI